MLRSIPAQSPLDFSRPAWLSGGQDGDVVLSSRFRIARNFRDYLFPHKLDSRARAEIERRVLREVGEPWGGAGVLCSVTDQFDKAPTDKPSARRTGSPIAKEEQDYRLIPIRLKDFDDDVRDSLAASLLAPVEFAYRSEGTLLADPQLTVSVLLNEEDHLRIQAFQSGSRIEAAAAIAVEIEQRLVQIAAPAWKEPYGYLTASPAISGSGARASVLCHLPALGVRRRLSRWLAAARDAGMTMRGVYGEGSRAIGAYFQLSLVGRKDELSLGTAHRLMGLVGPIVAEEREARETIGKMAAEKRALECVTFIEGAPTVTLGQGLRALSWFRLAAANGSAREARWVDEMFAAMLVDRWGTSQGSDLRRAQSLREWLAGHNGPRI